MTDMAVAELGRIPMAPNLAATLSRATEYARAQAHLEVTLEHMLLALLEDPDAALVLAASSVDPGRLSADISGHLGRIEERSPPDRPSQLVVSGDLRRILEAAAAAAQQGRRRDINGAIVLAAVIGDGKSSAAHMLSAHGLTFEGAIRALRGGGPAAPSAPTQRVDARAMPVAGSPEPNAPSPAGANAVPAGETIPSPEVPTGGRGAGTQPPPSMDDLLAAARERVRSRNAQAAAAPAPDVDISSGHAGGHEPFAEPDADGHASAPTLPAETKAPSPRAAPPPPTEQETRRIEPQGGRPATFEPQWMPAGVPTSVPTSLPAGGHGGGHVGGHGDAPTHAPAPQAGPQLPGAYAPTQPPQPRPQAGQPPSGGPFPPPRPSPAAGHVPPSGSSTGVHPHRPMPPDARLRPGEGQPPPQPPAPPGPPPRPAAQGRQALPPPQPATRPVHQPPPLPPPGSMTGPGAPPNSGPPPTPGQGPSPPPRPAGAPTPRPAPPPPLPAGGPQTLPTGHGASPSGPSLGPAAPAAERRREGPSTAAGGVQSGGAPSGAGPAAARRAGPAQGAPFEIGQLAHNIPQRMRIAVPERIEVRIGKADVKALSDGMQGGAVWRHEVTITKAMTVRLKAPDGGFYIESTSPETQWIDNTLGMMVDDFASWRWSVTPKERGRKRLQVVISARSVGADGMAAETALPDQIIEVQVRTNYARAAAKVAGWLLIALAGGALGKFGEVLIAPAWTLISKIAAG